MDQHSFYFQAIVYLAAAVIIVPLAKRLGLGSVLGYLLAGIIIGPAALGFVGQEGEDIMHFAEFGVVMMLFIIGLELEPELLWRLRKTIIGMGALQVIITAIVFSNIAVIFGLAWQQSLALGLILSLSSTAIVLQSLDEKGLMKTSAGQSSFSVLLFQDIAVIPMLALFPLLATAPEQKTSAAENSNLVHGLPAWLQGIIILGSVAAIILAGRFLVRPLFRIVAATRLREIFTATALLLVIGIAMLMVQVGLSPALGTFLAGVVLANSEYKHELESDIDPFKGLLLGLFFIAVGASIDFILIVEKPLIIFGLVAGLMLLKCLVLMLLGRIFRLQTQQNILFSLALSQVGEFAFVLFSFSLQKGILPKEVTGIMIAVVALSMAFTPLLLLINDKIFSKKFKSQPPEDIKGDVIGEDNPVIIAGFGHFGNTTGRFLRAHNIGTTVLDNNSERVELLRKMGFKVYYGDASRHEMLQAAGAARAKLIIITIEPNEKRLEMIETIKKHFPNLRMLVRAENRYDAYAQMNAGMLHVYRETVDTALRVGVDAMKFLGYRTYTAQRAARTFLKIDEANLKKLSAIKDTDEYITTIKQRIEELEKVIQQDNSYQGFVDTGWDEDTLIAEANRKNVST
ncbi:MAG: monovalent cation:proton antiporter-2 (CPA2) family protein [Flavisolibacter sp.]